MPAKESKKSPREKFSFEDTVARLEALIEKLEDGDLDLAESIAAFEEGVKLTRQAQDTIAQAEQEILQLVEKNGELVKQPLNPDDSDQ
jgi:exodeoxyribonuclease VII small subunit